MTDKDVGEYWVDVWRDIDPVGEHGGCRDGVIKLIRKLVEERARNNAVLYYQVHGPDADAIKSCIKSALRDFGIPPESWKE